MYLLHLLATLAVVHLALANPVAKADSLTRGSFSSPGSDHVRLSRRANDDDLTPEELSMMDNAHTRAIMQKYGGSSNCKKAFAHNANPRSGADTIALDFLYATWYQECRRQCGEGGNDPTPPKPVGPKTPELVRAWMGEKARPAYSFYRHRLVPTFNAFKKTIDRGVLPVFGRAGGRHFAPKSNEVPVRIPAEPVPY
ncbi:MAG: hypothetical protein M1826_002992 [Phylliscum demangeonii]|nr:MAG: hypothetical protein M1826_002992 [Phylliscum demangeonii]